MVELISIVTLLVAIATLVVSCLAYKYARQSDKKRMKDELARKEAMLKRINRHDFWVGMNQGVANTIFPKIKVLEAEIEELKRQLK